MIIKNTIILYTNVPNLFGKNMQSNNNKNKKQTNKQTKQNIFAYEDVMRVSSHSKIRKGPS
jgi:hypothetical protein